MANNSNNLRLNGLNPLSYMGVNPFTPVPFVSKAVDPTSQDYQNFILGTIWLNTDTEALWALVSLANHQATWVQFGGSSSNIQTLTGNIGGAVPPMAGNINIVGDGITINVDGNPGTSTLTIAATGAIADEYLTDDSNFAVPALGILTIHGTGGITTSSSGSTVTISGSGLVDTVNYTGIIHAQSPYTALTTDYYISANVTAGVISILLPNTPVTGRVFIVKDKVGLAATSNITVTTVGGAVTIDGATTFVMNTAYESVNLIFNGTSYEIW